MNDNVLRLIHDKIVRAREKNDLDTLVEAYLMIDTLSAEDATLDVSAYRAEHDELRKNPAYAAIAERVRSDLAQEAQDVENAKKSEYLVRFYDDGEFVSSTFASERFIPHVRKIDPLLPIMIDCYFKNDETLELRLTGNQDVPTAYAQRIAQAAQDKTVADKLRELYEHD